MKFKLDENLGTVKIYRDTLVYMLFLFLVITSHAFPVAFEEKRPEDEKLILVPKGARPALKEEYPRSQLVVDRIKERHRHTLSIPFFRSWNTAAFTALNGTEMEQNPQVGNDFELGFSLHSQRLRVGALRNKEYFQKETEGFPEGWYWPFQTVEDVNRPKGYMTTTFIHLAAKRIHIKYNVSGTDLNKLSYRDFSDRINGILNVIMKQNKQLTLTARRDMHNFRVEGIGPTPGIRNNASILYKIPSESGSKLELYGDSTWSTLTDSAQRDFQYVSGSGTIALGKNLGSGSGAELKVKLQASNLWDRTDYEKIPPTPPLLKGGLRGDFTKGEKAVVPFLMGKASFKFPSPSTGEGQDGGDLNTEEEATAEAGLLEQRRSARLEVSNVISLAGPLKLKLNIPALYDSKYKFHLMPGAELALAPKVIQASVGIRRRVILPDHDEIYWSSKIVEVNDDLRLENFWEAYSSLNVNILARLKLFAEASYSRPGRRITWEQLPGYTWKPVNKETSEALSGDASITLDLIRSLSLFAGINYQHYDTQLYEPEIAAAAQISYGNPVSGAIALGASYWDFQPLELSEPPEDFAFGYVRINKLFRRVLNIFVDGRYMFNGESVMYYRGLPQAGRIVSFGANIVFGGLD